MWMMIPTIWTMRTITTRRRNDDRGIELTEDDVWRIVECILYLGVYLLRALHFLLSTDRFADW